MFADCSYIFGENAREIFFEHMDSLFGQYTFVIRELYEYAMKDLFVIRNTHSGMISANYFLSMTFRIEMEQSESRFIPLLEPVVLDIQMKEFLQNIVKKINIVLYTIILGLSIDIKNYGK